MVLIGFPLWLGDKAKFKYKVDESHKAGFDFIELSLDYPWPVPDSSTPKKIADYIREAGLDLAVHGSWRDIRLASPIDEIREASVKYTLKLLEITEGLEPKYVVLHVSTDQAIEEARNFGQSIIDATSASIQTILDFAFENGLTILFENVPSNFCSSIDHIKRAILSVEGSEICFDVGHAQVQAVRSSNWKEVEVDVVIDEWFKNLGSKIRGVHVYDCLVEGGWINEHVAPSTSSKSIKSLLKWIKDEKSRVNFVVIEAFKDAKGNEIGPRKLTSLVRQVKTLA
ncbi:MAG: sugar phosphate isomerase/epimerase family protein [Candidatus Nezhaarchaeales archaeon]